MRKKEKESLSRKAQKVSRGVLMGTWLAFEAYYHSKCAECPYNPKKDIQTEAGRAQGPPSEQP